jgi:ankyrin repeat protein
MHWRKISGLVVLGLSLAAPAVAAQSAALADAAEQRDQTRVRTLLQAGVDVNAPQVDGTTALHWASFNDDVETVALLVRARANVNAVNRYGVPPLAEAATNGNAAIIKLLLDAGADANTTMKGGETVLMFAARSGNAEAVKALLAREAKHDARERRGQTALMWAAAEGHVSVVRALIAAGADMNATVETGLTPFFLAVREGKADVVREFLAAGVDVNQMMRRPETGRANAGGGGGGGRQAATSSALLLAVMNGHFELALALVDAGADPNDVRGGFTPLHTLPSVRRPDNSDGSDPAPPVGAGRISSLQFVREIVKRGANVNFRLPAGSPPRQPGTSSKVETDGATPFLFAADRADLPLMRLLLELGADPLLPNASNTTPLMAAAGVGTAEPFEEVGEEPEYLEATKWLLDLGADPNVVNTSGDTAMHGAAYNISPTVANLLAERGADPKIWNKPNKLGGTPLFIAEGYAMRLPRPEAAMIAALSKLMHAAGLSTEDPRPKMIDSYAPVAEREPPQPPTAQQK